MNQLTKRFCLLFAGFILIALGLSLQINIAYIGLEPWGAFHLALSNISLSVGTWTILIQFLFIFLTYLLDRKMPKIGTFLNMVFIGLLVDMFLLMGVSLSFGHFWLDIFVFILGMWISSVGAACAILSDLGPGSKTQFYVTCHNKFGIRLSTAKFSMEFLGLSLALVFGGPIMIGTLLFVLLSPLFISHSHRLLQKRIIFH